MNSKRIFVRLLLMMMAYGMPMIVFAQADFDDDVTDVPVDGGSGILIAMGVGYGLKKYRDNRKKGNNGDDRCSEVEK